jgi:hypothetical protein
MLENKLNAYISRIKDNNERERWDFDLAPIDHGGTSK